MQRACRSIAELSVGWVDPRVGLGQGSEMADVRKIHVMYICNFVSSIDWQIHFGRDFPVLSEVARRVVCISACSAQSERDFSCIGHTITGTRSRLSAEKDEPVELIRWGVACRPNMTVMLVILWVFALLR